MVSPASGSVLKDENRGDHIPGEHNRRLPPKSNSQSPSKPRKSNLKESTKENKSSSSRAGNHRSSIRNSNQYEVVMARPPLMSRRQARVLDRWAAQQARETMSTIERQKHCKYDISDSDYVSLSSRTPSRDPSPAASDSSVSSLVKKWREFETSRRQGQRESSFTGCSAVVSRTSSMASSFSEQESNSTSTWDVDRSQGGGGGGAAEERVRVVDIIKKLPLLECGDATTLCSNAVLSSPRIRGRQAVSDLLAKLEHDRYSEIKSTSKRQAVSNFPRRAFLQSMLKLRLLRLEVAAQDQRIQVQLLEKCESSSSVNNNQRERINPAIAECFDFIKTRHTEIDKLISNLVTREICTSNQEPQSTQVIENKHQGETCSAQINNVVSRGGKDQGTSNTSFRSSSVHEKLTMQEAAEKVNAQPDAAWTKTSSEYSNEIVDCISRETKNTSPYEAWEQENEQHMTCQDEQIKQENGTNLEWINDVSRPRSYWESLRQAWYQEMFTTSSKHEIRQLIERASVATVLASDFRERMDGILMMSSSIQERAQRIGYDITEGESHSSCAAIHHTQMQVWSNQLDEEQEGQDLVSVEEEPTENVEEIREELKQQQVQGQKHAEEDELESLSFHQSNRNNRGYYYEQDHGAPSPDLGWRKYNNQEESLSSYERDTQGEGGCSLKNSSSIEMELIYDLRAHMEQMEREMRELRMWQNKLQSSIRDEVSAVLGLQPAGKKLDQKGKGNESNAKAPKKGCCCICYQNKVDSVLYRCGHMCACFKCAHELRRSSGKCPICRARIVDVVRVFNHA